MSRAEAAGIAIAASWAAGTDTHFQIAKNLGFKRAIDLMVSVGGSYFVFFGCNLLFFCASSASARNRVVSTVLCSQILVRCILRA